MSNSGLQRREVLVAVSGGCSALAGCSERGPSGSLVGATRSGYGTAYGREYGYGGE